MLVKEKPSAKGLNFLAEMEKKISRKKEGGKEKQQFLQIL